MSSPVPVHTPSSPFTPRSRRLSNPPASNYSTPTRHNPFTRHVSSSTPLSHTAPAPTNPTDEFGLDDNDDDLISMVGGGVYIDEDVDMDKERHSDDEQDEEDTGDVTGFSEVDADMTVFANLKNHEGGTVAQAQQDVLPSSSQLSGGGVSVSAGIIEEGEEDDDNDTEIMDGETGMSPVQHFATLGSGEAANTSPSTIRPQTPTRSPIAGSPTPRAPSSMARHSRASSRSSVFSMISPSSPSRHATSSSIRPFQERDQTTQLLLDDFTAQFNAVNQPPQQSQTPNHHTLQNHHVHSSRGSINGLFSPQPSKCRSETTGTPTKRSTAGTPDNNNRFLIDFDILPPQTPRSIPSITLREVEKLKSEFLTQLGELKAQLSGKDAEVLNLRESLREAESRCGNLREEVETLEQGKADAEGILAKFREQAQTQFEDARREWDEERERVVKDANEAREKFEAEVEMVRVQFGEMEKMSNEAREREERMRQELEATKKEMEIVRSNTPAPAYTPIDPNANRPAPCANCANRGGSASGGASKEEVDRIAKELHVLYKQKHETKVAALKKSYEQRWEKKVKALESEIETLKATLPQTQPAAELEEFITKAQTLTQELEDVKVENENLKGENKQLNAQVQKERREKGELVGAVEEMLALQMQTLSEAVTAAEEERHEATSTQKTNPRPQAQAAPSAGVAPSKSSGLAKPGTLKVKDVKKLEKGWEGVRRRASGIGITSHGETGGVTGIAAPRVSGLAAPRAGGASALRGGIERMGRGAGPAKD